MQERQETGHPSHPLCHCQRLDDEAAGKDRLQRADPAQLCRHQRQPLASSDYVRHKQELVDTGLEIHEYIGKISYHGKSIAIDDRLAIVGSFNMDMRSTYLDTELMLVIDSPEVTQALKASMDVLDAQAAVVADAEHYRSLPNGMAEPSLSTGKQVVQFFTGWALELGRFLL